MVANWMVGREIVEEKQHGKERAGYLEGLVVHEAVLSRLSGVNGRTEDFPRSAWKID